MGGSIGCQWFEHVKWTHSLQGFASMLLMSVALQAAPPLAADQRELDGDFLEFLGSIDTEAEGWSEFLENTEIDKAAQPPNPVPAPHPAPATPPAKPPLKAPTLPVATPPTTLPPKAKAP
jgi:hypothetical protein